MNFSHQHMLPLFIRARLLQMFLALEKTGGTPIDTISLHSFAFFANVLSPLWDLYPLEGSVLKDGESPYFPALQKELDRLVGLGLVEVVALKSGEENQLHAEFRLRYESAEKALDLIRVLPDEAEVEAFLLELADAFVEIRPELRDDAARLDAAYSDPGVAEGRVVDFAEWVSPTRGNASWNTAQKFQQYVEEGVTLNRAEKLVMYMRLMQRRANG
ncbi:hypothetical protein JET14_05985 [Martelella lutilitoris]|uniref:Uncharacterized protein n=1 Tax=Martelella lutilitoris TaxID=2583532 RepID=A0A7T7HM74_9HYPH|nr:hypothetical protein [Martelella lutilitoris]QQM31717.1 hypothetical protein JET14_05985 [Martelella lutilitoris]